MSHPRVNPNQRLEDQGIIGVARAYYNLLEPALMTEAIARGEGKLGLGGAFFGHDWRAYGPLAQG